MKKKRLHLITICNIKNFQLFNVCVISVRSGSHVSSSVSLKSDQSKDGELPNFSEKTPSSNERYFVILFFLSHVDCLKVVSVNTNHETSLDQIFVRVFTADAYFSFCKISVSVLFY